MVKVTLKEYLEKLRRKHGSEGIPTLQDIAQAANTSFVSLSRIANNHMKMLNVTTIGGIVTYLRDCGYDTELSDILTYEAPSH